MIGKEDWADTERPPRQAPPHAEPVEGVLARFGVDPRRGLDLAEVAERSTRFGPNQLQEAAPPPMSWRFLGQFLEPMVAILITAAVISGLSGDVIDTLAILAIVLLNGMTGFIQEERAERALSALRRLSAPSAKVLRGGQPRSVPARELVPGDRIVLEAGDSVPADARLIRSFDLRVQEAALTGESIPVAKGAAEVLDPQTPLGDRSNMVFLGTVVAAGKADAVAVAIGMGTELGRIAGMLAHAEREPTPLQRRLAELGKILIVVVKRPALIRKPPRSRRSAR
jgi:Ca2+-transporting ATPase